MRAQRNMKLLLQRQKYLIKNMGALMPVPIAAIYVLALPLCIVQSRNGNAEELRSFVSQFSQGVFSVLSVWWVIFGVREYFEADGCEVLFLHNRRGFLPDAILFYSVCRFGGAVLYNHERGCGDIAVCASPPAAQRHILFRIGLLSDVPDPFDSHHAHDAVYLLARWNAHLSQPSDLPFLL